MIDAARQLIARYAHINWAVADQSMVSGINFLTGILLARFLGLDEFGRFTLIWMAVLFVNSIQHAAINSPMMSLGPKQSAAGTAAYYGAVIVQQIAFSFAAFLLLFSGVKLSILVFPEWHVNDLALPLAVTALTCQFQDFLRRYFFTRGRAATAFVITTTRYLGQLTVLTWLFFSVPDSMDIANVLWVLSLTAAVATIYGALRLDPVKINAEKVRKFTLDHWGFAKWLVASAIMQSCTGNLFIIAAGALLGASAVGALKAAQNLMGITHILFMGLENIVPIRAARLLHEAGRTALTDYLKKVTWTGGAVTLIVALIMAISPEFWLKLVFGTEYLGYGYLLQWYAIINLLIFFSIPLRSGLRACQQTQTIFRSFVWMTLFSLLATYPAVKLMALNGVMMGILIVSLIQLVTLKLGFSKLKTI